MALLTLLFLQTPTIFEEPEKVAGGGAGVLVLLRRLQPLLLPLQLGQVGCVHLVPVDQMDYDDAGVKDGDDGDDGKPHQGWWWKVEEIGALLAQG